MKHRSATRSTPTTTALLYRLSNWDLISAHSYQCACFPLNHIEVGRVHVLALATEAMENDGRRSGTRRNSSHGHPGRPEGSPDECRGRAGPFQPQVPQGLRAARMSGHLLPQRELLGVLARCLRASSLPSRISSRRLSRFFTGMPIAWMSCHISTSFLREYKQVEEATWASIPRPIIPSSSFSSHEGAESSAVDLPAFLPPHRPC
jgi:hypothetical protein